MASVKKYPVVVGLDIGTTKIAAIVGQMDQHGKINILGIGKADSHGVARGEVVNIEMTVSAIRTAVEEAERQSGVQITQVFVFLPCSLNSLQNMLLNWSSSPKCFNVVIARSLRQFVTKTVLFVFEYLNSISAVSFISLISCRK